jgi:dipeptidyl aminopeptidase/acylaminoacyl peptidase
MEALGPPAFNFCGRRFTRTDFTLRTKRGYNLECSHWEPVERVVDRIPVVIYMHGNSSARVEVIPQLSYLLSLGLAVFAFDFAGSGKSDGDFVSLGYYEREDLSCIVAHLRATNVVSTIALWGRSMGAATALMFGDRDPSIACMILDSSFSDLTQLCEEMVEKGREQGIVVPNIVVSVAIRMLTGSVKKQAGFNIKSISPIAHADKCFIPALFVAGEHDDFIKKHHSEQIYERYAGDKNLIIVEGDHNSPRPKFMFDSASIFLVRVG